MLFNNMIRGDLAALLRISKSKPIYPVAPRYPSHPSLKIRSAGSKGNHIKSIPV
jgi:hypothetical protein